NSETVAVNVSNASLNSSGNPGYHLNLTVSVGSAFKLGSIVGDNAVGSVTNEPGSCDGPCPIQATVSDSNGNPVSGVSVTFSFGSVPSGATGQALKSTSPVDGSTTSITVTTDGSGMATAFAKFGTKSGIYRVVISSGNLVGSPGAVFLIAKSGAPAGVTLE